MQSATHIAHFANVPLGDGSVRIIAPLVGRTEMQLKKELLATHEAGADILEWRADFLETVTSSALTQTAMTLRGLTLQPVLFTLRTAAEGGELDITDADYGNLTRYFAASGFADAIDLEVNRGADASVTAAHDAGIPVVMSYHNFEATPSAKVIGELFARMDTAGGDVLKVAVMPEAPEDVLRLMTAALKARRAYGKPVIAISMGALGRVTRAAGALFGSDATFAALQTGSAPGQIGLGEMKRLLELFAA